MAAGRPCPRASHPRLCVRFPCPQAKRECDEQSRLIAARQTRPDLEFSVRQPEVLEAYLRDLVAAAAADDSKGAFCNMTVRFTSPPNATATLALEELAGVMARAADALRGALAAAASDRARGGKGQKHRQAGSLQPLAYRNRRPTPSAAPSTTTDAARVPSHTMDLSDAFAKVRQPSSLLCGPYEDSGPRGGTKGGGEAGEKDIVEEGQ